MGGPQGVDHFADNIKLQLVGSGIADSHRPRILVAGQPGALPIPSCGVLRPTHKESGSPTHRRRPPAAANRASAGFFVIAAGDHRAKRERGVAKPAEAVVPISSAAELLGKRCRRGRDHAAGRLERQRLERDQRADDGFAPRPLIRAAIRPLAPPAFRFAPIPRRPARSNASVDAKGTTSV